LSNARRPRGADSLVRFSAHTNSTKFGVYTSANSMADGALFVWRIRPIPDSRHVYEGLWLRCLILKQVEPSVTIQHESLLWVYNSAVFLAATGPGLRKTIGAPKMGA
jgi:hypothetical protein